MRRSSQLRVLMLIVSFAYMAGGCTPEMQVLKDNPRKQWAAARTTVTGTENAMVAANKARILSDDDFVATEPFANACQGALQKADEELTANDDKVTDRFKFYMQLVDAALAKLQNYQVLTKPDSTAAVEASK